MSSPHLTVEELVSGRAWTTSFFDIRSYLSQADTLETAMIQYLWFRYISLFAPPSTLLANRLGTLTRSVESYADTARLPENLKKAWMSAFGYSPYSTQKIRGLKTLLARTEGSDLLKILIAHEIFASTRGLESDVASDIPLLRIFPCGSLGITRFLIKPNAVAFKSTSDEEAFLTAPKGVQWMYRTLNGLKETTSFDDAIRALSLVAVPMNPASFAQDPAPANIIATLVNGVDVFTDPDTSYSVRSLVMQSLLAYRATSNSAAQTVRNLFSWATSQTFAGASPYESSVYASSAVNDLCVGSTPVKMTTISKTLTSLEALGSRLDMPFTMDDIDGGDDDTDDSSGGAQAKKKSKETSESSAKDDVSDDGTDPNEADDGSGGVSPSDDTASGDDSGDAPGGNLFNNSNSIGEDVSKNNNDIDLLKGGSDQAVIRETLFRCAVASLNDSLAQRTDLAIPRDTRTQLSDWCTFFLFTVKPEQTKRFLKKLGLDKVLEPVTL